MQDYYRALRGSCVSCGFLSKWSQGGPGAGCYELDWTGRLDGKAYSHYLIFQGEIITIPFCFQRVVNFEDAHEVGLQTPLLEERERATAEVFQRNRQCPKWHPYRPGLDPKEHLRELRMLEQEQRREEFEQKMEQDRRAFEERMEKERRAFEERLAQRAEESEERRHTLVLWIAAAAVILALAEVGAAILGAGPGSLIGKLIGLD